MFIDNISIIRDLGTRSGGDRTPTRAVDPTVSAGGLPLDSVGNFMWITVLAWAVRRFPRPFR